MDRPLRTFLVLLIVVLSYPHAAAAQTCPATPQAECLCDPQTEDCRSKLINLIRNEKVGIDVAFWFMEDARYTTELINRHKAGVPIRVLVDQRANASKRLNEQILNTLRDGLIPMRDKFGGDILHHKFMLFQGQDMVEFSKANYTGISFVPSTPNVNYFDEVIFFSNDPNITNSFRRRFEDNWKNTSIFRNLYNMTDPLLSLAQNCSTCTIHSSMNFVPLQNFATRMIGRIDKETQAIDAIVYRVTYHGQADAMIRAVSRGVAVRLITEPSEYRNPDRLWVAKHLDRMYVAHVPMKWRKHEGLMHQGSIVLRGLGEVIFGSSNWTTASNGYQDEHNYFYNPSLGKPWFYDYFADQFDRKWNDTTNYVPFQPKPPTSPLYSLPANGAGGVSSSATLTWDGGNWAHLYDIYFGTNPNPPLIATNLELGSPVTGTLEKYTVTNLLPGTTYYWRIVSKTWAYLTNSGPVWSFTTAGGTGASTTGNTPFGGTPAALPGTFQAENFDNGGQNIAWFDTTVGNAYGAYRSTDVDIEPTTDGGGYNVAKTKAGEWLEYTVNVTASGTYAFQARVANVGTGATFRVYVDGTDVTGPIAVPDTGGWQTWMTLTGPRVALSAGPRVVRIYLATISSGGGVGNFNWFQFVQ
jgi:hypothetical protein